MGPAQKKGIEIIYLPLGAAALGGAERSLLELAAQMKLAGHQPLILCEQALVGTGYAEMAAKHRVSLKWVDWAPEKGFAHDFVSAWRTFRRFRRSVVHFNIAWRRHMWVVPVAARLAGCRALIGTMRAMPDPVADVPRAKHFGFIPGFRLWTLPDHAIARIWAWTLRLTVSVNRDDYPARLVRDFGFDPRRLRVIHNGVHAPNITSSPGKAGEVRLLYIGRLSPEKGVNVLIDALDRLPDYYRLEIAGEGPHASQLGSLVTAKGLEERVTFSGFVPVPAEAIARSDLVVVPSLWAEAFGRVVPEAMIMGIPVVATAVGGMAELFNDGVEGLYVPKGDPVRLAGAILTLGEDPARREAMGKAARKRALSDYTVERVAAQYLALYDELAGQP